jgi:hypothetical protein
LEKKEPLTSVLLIGRLGYPKPSIPMACDHAIGPFGQPLCRREPQPPQQKLPTREVGEEREKRFDSLEHFS